MKTKNLLLLLVFSSVYTVNAQNIFPTSGSVGIGTANPQDLLNIDAGNTRKGLTIRSQGDENAYSDIQFAIKNSSLVPSDRPFQWVISHRKDGYFSGSDLNGSSLEFYAIHPGGSYFAPLSFKSNGDIILASEKNAVGGNVGIGTISPKEKLSVNGKIRAYEIKVEATNWPDYVFAPRYRLLPLPELEKYILLNGHLPEVTSAEEVKKNGVDLGETNAQLLKKIEELTLYLIEKDQELKTEKIRNDNQEKEIAAQGELIKGLIKRNIK